MLLAEENRLQVHPRWCRLAKYRRTSPDWTSPMTKIILRGAASFLMAALAMNPGIIPS